MERKTYAALLHLAMGPPSVGDRVTQMVQIIEGLDRSGDAEARDEALRASVEHLRTWRSAPKASVAFGAHQLGHLGIKRSTPALARAAFQLSAERFAGESMTQWHGTVLHDIGRTWQMEGNDTQARDAFLAASTLKRAVDGLSSPMSTLVELAEAERQLGNVEGSRDALRRAQKLIEGHWSDPIESVQHLRAVGLRAEGWDEYDIALDAYKLAARMYYDIGDRDGLATALADVGRTHEGLGDTAAALENFRQAADSAGEAPDDWRFTVQVGRARMANAEGDEQERDAAMAAATELLRKGDPEVNGRAGEAHQLGRLAERLDRYEEARMAYEIARAALAELELPREEAIALTDIGDTWRSQGDSGEALTAYRRAAELALQGPTDETLVTALRSLAETAHATGDDDACDAAIAEALGRLERDLGPGDERKELVDTIVGCARRLGRPLPEPGTPAGAEEAEPPSDPPPSDPPPSDPPPPELTPCWCGSGRRFDRCHGARRAA